MGGFWDERFAGERYVYGTEPNAFLVRHAGAIPPKGKVLVPGDGEGRNGVWLAEQGHSVLSLDASAVGLAKAAALADRRGVAIATQAADLTAWDWPVGVYDAVVSIFVHFAEPARSLINERMMAALRPGGVLVFVAFRPEQLAFDSGGPKDPKMLYSAADLRSAFAGAEILALEEENFKLEEGPYHSGEAAVIGFLARKA